MILDELAKQVTAWCQAQTTHTTGWHYRWSVLFIAISTQDEEPFLAVIDRWRDDVGSPDADEEWQDVGQAYGRSPEEALRAAFAAALEQEEWAQ